MPAAPLLAALAPLTFLLVVLFGTFAVIGLAVAIYVMLDPGDDRPG